MKAIVSLCRAGWMCSNIRMAQGRVLALDYGTKNIGLARSDELRITVEPLPSVPRGNRRDLLARLKSMIVDHEIEALIVGMPLKLDGSRGEAAARAAAFIEDLRQGLTIPVHEVDERLSTVEATEIWHTMSPRRQQKYRTVDSLAAAIILKRFLEEK